MIKLIVSKRFTQDLEDAISWLNEIASVEGKSSEEFEHKFKSSLIHIIKRIQGNPFLYPNYNELNPIRRAIVFHGSYVINYLVVPYTSLNRTQVEEIILTALVPSRSRRYKGAYNEQPDWHFNDLVEQLDED